MYALIRDKTNDSQRLPLGRAVRALVASFHATHTHLVVSMASGYGLRVNDLDDATEGGSEVTVSLSELMEIIDAEDEWFYELRVRDANRAFAFGIVDSTAVLIQAEEEVVRRVTATFSDVAFYAGELET